MLEVVYCHPNIDYLNVNNKMFEKTSEANSSIYSTLFEHLKKNQINIGTLDVVSPEKAVAVFFLEAPLPWKFKYWKLLFKYRTKSILISHEPPIINPFNYLFMTNFLFKKILTWNDDLVDNRRYFKACIPQSLYGYIAKNRVQFQDKKLLTLINGNKGPFLPFIILSPFGTEIYTKRIAAIEYFEVHHPEAFDLYGEGWNLPKKYNISERVFGYKRFSCYRGPVADKIEVLSRYKFCICFENMTDAPGYLTEKIFDCFKARCVPIYWGASDVEKIFPKDCFIDFRDFQGSYEKLYQFLCGIDEATYSNYIEKIEELLADKEFYTNWFEEGHAVFFTKLVQDFVKS